MSLSTTEALRDLVLHVSDDDGGRPRSHADSVVRMVELLRRAGSGDPTLLSSVPGRPRRAMAEKGWKVLGQRLCRRERAERGGPHVYVREAKGARVWTVRVAVWMA